MNRESLIIFTLAIVLSAGIVGGLYYFSLEKLNQPSAAETLQSEPQAAAKQSRPQSPPSTGRTANIMKCIKPDGSEFWTNAVECDDADLNNRISRADPVKPLSSKKHSTNADKPTKSGKSYQTRSQKSTLQSLPQTMPVSCKFPIGMARKIERKSLSLKSDPADSIWKKSYCRWVCDATAEGCGELSDYLEYTKICPTLWRVDKRSCGAT